MGVGQRECKSNDILTYMMLRQTNFFPFKYYISMLGGLGAASANRGGVPNLTKLADVILECSLNCNW